MSYRIPDFDTFLFEKQGVVLRQLEDEDKKDMSDVFGISKIINNFIDAISKRDPFNDYTQRVEFLGNTIELKYLPNTEEHGGITDGKDICIFDVYSKGREINIKYTLAHELVHMIQTRKSKEDFHNLTPLENIRYTLIQIDDDDLKILKSKNLRWFVYYLDIREIQAWNQNVYLFTLKLKKNYPNYKNSKIVELAFENFKITKYHMKNALDEIDHIFRDEAIDILLSLLVGQFFEIKMRGYRQTYFGKEVFQLDSIKKMRNEMKEIVKKYGDNERQLQNEIGRLITHYRNTITPDDFDVIIDSFKKYFEYWLNYARKRVGKAISLGIEDATPDKEKKKKWEE